VKIILPLRLLKFRVLFLVGWIIRNEKMKREYKTRINIRKIAHKVGRSIVEVKQSQGRNLDGL